MAKRKMKVIGAGSSPYNSTQSRKINNVYNFAYDDPTDWQNQALAPNPVPPVGREYDERQMPVDWDYKTAVTGPTGEALPDQALGWNYHGQPDFGSGLGGWWKKMTWKLAEDNTVASEGPTIKSIIQNVKDTYDHWDAQTEVGEAPKGKEFGQALLTFVGGVAQGIGSAWRNAENTDSKEVNGLFRAGGAFFDTVGMSFEALDRAVKEHVTVPLALHAAASLRLNEAAPQETIDQWRDWIGPLGLFPLYARGALASLTGKKLDDVTRDRNLLASQLGYTAWKETATKEEYIRRVTAGEDPRLLAMELQNPIDEMFAEMLFDPLNYLSLGAKTLLSITGDIRQGAKAAQLGAKARGLIEAVQTAEDVTAPWKRFTGWLDELSIQTAKNLSGEAREASDWGGLRGLISQTADSRRSGITEDMSDFVHEMLIRTGNPDDAMRLLREMGELFNPSATDDIRKMALKKINFYTGGRSIPASSLFGERGQRTAMIWRKLVGDDDAAKLVAKMEEAGGDVVKMNELLGDELRRITNDVFPTIKNRIDDYVEYKKLIDAGEDTTTFLKKKPWAAEAPNALHEKLYGIYEPLQKRFYRPAGKIQGTVFMGMNPAYRMRNRMGNFAVLFVDQGPGAAFMSLMDNRVMPWGKKWASKTLDNWMGDVGLQAQTRGIGKSAAGAAASFQADNWMSGKFNYFARKASADEAIAGVHIMSRAVKRVVSRVLTPKKALADIASLVEPEDMKTIQRLAKNYGGDVNRAFRTWADANGVDDISNLLFLDDRQMFMLRGLEIDESVRLALDSSLTRTERIDKLDEIIEAHRAFGSEAAGESVIRADPEFMEDMSVGIEGIGGLRGERAGDAFDRKLTAKRMYVDSAKEARNQLFKKLKTMVHDQFQAVRRQAGQSEKEARHAADLFIDDIVDAADARIDRLIRGKFNPKTGEYSGGLRAEMTWFRNDTWKLSDGANATEKSMLFELWQSRGEKGWMQNVPESIDDFGIQDFKDALWNGYFDRSERKWHEAFNEEARLHMEVVEKIAAGLDPDGTGKLDDMMQPMLDNVRRKQGISDAMHRAVMDDDGYMHMYVSPGELEDMIVAEWVKLNDIRVDEVEGLKATPRKVQNFINELRIQNEAGTLDLDKIIWDPVIEKAIENTAGSKAEAKNLLRTLVSQESDDILKIEDLNNRISVWEDIFPDRPSITNRVREIQDELQEIGHAATTPDMLVTNSPVQFLSKDGVLIDGKVVGKTPTGQIRIETLDGIKVTKPQSKIIIPDDELEKAGHLETLRLEEADLNNLLENVVPDQREAAKQAKIDEWQRQIDEIQDVVDRDQTDLKLLAEERAELVELDDITGREEKLSDIKERRARAKEEREKLSPEEFKAREAELQAEIDKFDKEERLLPSKDWYAEGVRRAGTEGTVYRVKLNDEGAFGYVQLAFGRDEGRKFYLSNMWIPDEFKRQGLSNKLMDHVKDLSDEARVPFDLLPMGSGRAKEIDTEGLIELYTKMGLKPVEIDDVVQQRLADATRRMEYKPKPKTQEQYGVRVITPQVDGSPSPAAMSHRSSPHIKKLVDEIKEHVSNNEPGTVKAGGKYSNEQIEEIRKATEMAQTKVNEARTVAGKIASAERDFGLHDYGRRYGFDLVAGLIFPYQFWYSRSYVKWMKRLVQNPGLLSAYMRYRSTLEKLHAGMPNWWKYQLNTNELLGMDEKNPLYFNLEAMINPLNGLTNVDFSDPERRKDWWGGAMEDIQKMGPSVWTPFTLALSAYYSFKGEKEAAARWAGRLLPQSKSIRDVTALIDPKGLGVEIDPNVHLFSGGVEAYERGRVGRQLGMMLNEGQWSKEDIIDAGYTQTGDIWDTARARAIHDRGGNGVRIAGQFFLGVGAKPRPAADMQIDNMYREMSTLIASRPNMPEDKYRDAWNTLREAYPFMDTVLLSKKGGLARDEALSWNVINRIPPGMSYEMAEKVSMDYDVLSQFRESKGDLSAMSEPDRMEFMAGVMQLNAILAIPDPVSVRDWTKAKNSYSNMMQLGETVFGEDIWQKVDLYYAAFDEENQDDMRNFIRANPIVEEALNFKQMTINGDPLLQTYYGGVEKLEKFYKGQFYQTAEQVFGEGIWDKWSVYHQLKDMGETKATNKFFKDNPELKGYLALRDDVMPVIDEKVTELGKQIQPTRGPFYRDENTMPDPNVGVQSFNVNEQQQWIDDQVMAYMQGQSDVPEKYTDVVDIVRNQANAIWPNTVRPAREYYKLTDTNLTRAADMLQENPELEARIKWEFDKIMRIALARDGELEVSAARYQQELASIGAPESPTSFEQLAPGPLQRLLNDPEGLPPHLWDLVRGQ